MLVLDYTYARAKIKFGELGYNLGISLEIFQASANSPHRKTGLNKEESI
jgi:hypothetical protein